MRVLPVLPFLREAVGFAPPGHSNCTGTLVIIRLTTRSPGLYLLPPKVYNQRERQHPNVIEFDY